VIFASSLVLVDQAHIQMKSRLKSNSTKTCWVALAKLTLALILD